MAELTGHHVARVEIKPETADRIRSLAKSAQTHLMCLGINRFVTKPPGMISGHAYAILGYEAKNDTLHIWNPWGVSHKPKGPPGIAHGYVTENGHFHMPVHDLVTVVKGTVSHETNQPRTKEDRLSK